MFRIVGKRALFRPVECPRGLIISITPLFRPVEFKG